MPFKKGVCFSQFCGNPIIKSRWPSRPDSLGIPSPFVRSSGWEAWRGVQNLHNSGRTSLVLLFSSLWITHLAGMGFDFTWLCPSYHSLWLLCLLTWGICFWWFQHPPVYGCSTASYNSGALAGGDECTFFYSAILNQKPESWCFLTDIYPHSKIGAT